MDEQIVGPARGCEVVVVARERLQPWVGGLDEDVRFVAGLAQHVPDPERLVPDGIAIAERREYLVDRGTCGAHAPTARDTEPAASVRGAGWPRDTRARL